MRHLAVVILELVGFGALIVGLALGVAAVLTTLDRRRENRP